MKWFILSACVGVLAFWVSTAAPQESAPKQAAKPWATRLNVTIGKLNSLPDEEAAQVFDNLLGFNSELRAALLECLDTATTNRQRCRAVYLMGKYRLKDTTDTLTRLITLKSERAPGEPVEPWAAHPAAEALTRIGHRSLAEMLFLLQTSDDNLTRTLASGVIKDVAKTQIQRSGKVEDIEFSEAILHQAIATQSVAEKKERLQKALKYITKQGE